MEHGQTKVLSEDTRCRPVSRDFRWKKIPSQYFKTSREVIRLHFETSSICSVMAASHLCHETGRFRWNRFGPMFAAEITKRRAGRLRA